MSQRKGTFMAQKTEYLNVPKIEYFNVAHVSKTSHNT